MEYSMNFAGCEYARTSTSNWAITWKPAGQLSARARDRHAPPEAPATVRPTRIDRAPPDQGGPRRPGTEVADRAQGRTTPAQEGEMKQTEVQRDVRSAIAIAYELLRHEKIQERVWVADALGELESELARIEAKLGGPRIDEVFPSRLDQYLAQIERIASDAGPVVGAQIETLVRTVKGIERQLRRVAPSRELASRPLFGVLPLKRVIPQDVHSVADYASALTVGAASLFACSRAAKIAGMALGAGGIGVSATTDYRLSVAKVIPIEAHEAIDHLWGLAAIAAPFVLGYAKKDPIVAAVHVATGASVILASLFTDYRAAIGVGHSAG
jgi:hypothetical protein